jgi:hypothetical protein
MPPKNNTLINNQSSACNSIQSGSSDEVKSLKIVIAENTQNTQKTNSKDWIIKTGKCSISPGNSPTSKVNNKNHNKFTYNTPIYYKALNVIEE